MINISVWNILGFAIGLSIFTSVLLIIDNIKEWRRRKEGRECMARFEAEKGKFRPDQTPLDELLQTVMRNPKPKGRISYETFFTDIEAMGFKEEVIPLSCILITSEDSPYRFSNRYVAKDLFTDCSVVLYTNFNHPFNHIRIDYIDNSTPSYDYSTTEYIFATLESFNGSLNDLIIKLHDRYVEHCGGFNLNNNTNTGK